MKKKGVGGGKENGIWKGTHKSDIVSRDKEMNLLSLIRKRITRSLPLTKLSPLDSHVVRGTHHG